MTDDGSETQRLIKEQGKTKRIIITKPNLSRGWYRHPRLNFHPYVRHHCSAPCEIESTPAEDQQRRLLLIHPADFFNWKQASL